MSFGRPGEDQMAKEGGGCLGQLYSGEGGRQRGREIYKAALLHQMSKAY